MEQITLQTEKKMFEAAFSTKHKFPSIMLKRQTAFDYRCQFAYVCVNLRMTCCVQDRMMT
jgi:hypothetical protein